MIEMKTIENTEQELVDDFAEFEDMFDKFGYLIDLGNNTTSSLPLKPSDIIILAPLFPDPNP